MLAGGGWRASALHGSVKPAQELKLSTCLLLQDAMASFATAAISVGLLVSASAHAANDNVWWLVRRQAVVVLHA